MQVMVAYTNGDISEVEYGTHTIEAVVCHFARKVSNGTVRWFAVVGVAQPDVVEAIGGVLDKNP